MRRLQAWLIAYQIAVWGDQFHNLGQQENNSLYSLATFVS